MLDKPLNQNDLANEEGATDSCRDIADFRLGSTESRAAARALLQSRCDPHELAVKAAEEKDHQRVWDLCKDMSEISFERGALLWLTQYTKTEDTHWLKKGTPPVAPFPKKEYFVIIARELMKWDVVFIEKSREMMTSWLACGLITHMAKFLPHVQWVMQTEKEDKVVALVNYCRILERRQDQWMQDRNPLVMDNTTHLKWRDGGEIIGVPKGANQFRLYHPYGTLFDEAAFLPEFMQAYGTVKPVSKKIWAISSAGPGAFADACGSHTEGMA